MNEDDGLRIGFSNGFYEVIMKKMNKKRGNDGRELKRKEVTFRLPLREFLKLFPDIYFYLPMGLDVEDPRYVVRFRPSPKGGITFEFGYEEDTWTLE